MELKGNIDNLAYETHMSAGFDFRSAVDIEIKPQEGALVMTGVYIDRAFPDEELQIRSRSGLALKNQVIVLNAPATIDADYRGEIGVILYNLGKQAFKVEVGDRIAQGVLSTVRKVSNVPTKEVERKDGGFGSTGVK